MVEYRHRREPMGLLIPGVTAVACRYPERSDSDVIYGRVEWFFSVILFGKTECVGVRNALVASRLSVKMTVRIALEAIMSEIM